MLTRQFGTLPVLDVFVPEGGRMLHWLSPKTWSVVVFAEKAEMTTAAIPEVVAPFKETATIPLTSQSPAVKLMEVTLPNVPVAATLARAAVALTYSPT